MTHAAPWNITAGQWCFRHRNAVFPAVFLLVPAVLRPRLLFGSPAADHLLTAAGVLIALTGEAVRLLTIGFEYIDRGGKNKQVWASRLVQGGIYGHTRNPMYLGNLLIAAGMCMVSGAPAAYVIVLPIFLFVYGAIMATEEAFLHHKFGADYVAYCSRVPRMLPSLTGLRHTLSSGQYHWRRAVRKELSTLAGLLLGLIALPVWRTYFLRGPASARAEAPVAIGLALAVLAAFGALVYFKKRRMFFYLPADFLPHD